MAAARAADVSHVELEIGPIDRNLNAGVFAGFLLERRGLHPRGRVLSPGLFVRVFITSIYSCQLRASPPVEAMARVLAVRRAEPWVDVVGFTQKRRHENVEIINVDGCVGLARRERERLARFQGTHSHIPPTSRP